MLDHDLHILHPVIGIGLVCRGRGFIYADAQVAPFADTDDNISLCCFDRDARSGRNRLRRKLSGL